MDWICDVRLDGKLGKIRYPVLTIPSADTPVRQTVENCYIAHPRSTREGEVWQPQEMVVVGLKCDLKRINVGDLALQAASRIPEIHFPLQVEPEVGLKTS